MQPGRGTSKRREFIASRILRGQLLYYCVMVVSTGATGFLLVFDVLKSYNQVSNRIRSGLNVAFMHANIPHRCSSYLCHLTWYRGKSRLSGFDKHEKLSAPYLYTVHSCSSACNIVLSMRSPVKGTVDMDHGLSLLPPRSHRVEIDIETDQVHGYPPTLEGRSVSSPSLQKEVMVTHPNSTNDSSPPESHDKERSRSPVSNAPPLKDPFDVRETPATRAPFDDGIVQPTPYLRFRRNTLEGVHRMAAAMPHLHRNGASVDVDTHGQHFELPQQQGLDGIQVERDVVTPVERKE